MSNVECFRASDQMSSASLKVSNLRCEYLVDPIGIDELQPRLSWTVEADRRGARQAAYRIRVSSTAQKCAACQGDLWDTGRVASDRTTHISYGGQRLKARDVCHWNVEVWDDEGNSAMGRPGLWTMGLL